MIKLKSNEVLEPYDYFEDFLKIDNNKEIYEMCCKLGEFKPFYDYFYKWELTQPVKFVIRNVDDDRVNEIMEELR